jgi:NAD(P)-dependent dehydrogenase (short-subunit alcohol dehydrogenase family)
MTFRIETAAHPVLNLCRSLSLSPKKHSRMDRSAFLSLAVDNDVEMTRTLSHELGVDNIRVNCIMRGAILTERASGTTFCLAASLSPLGHPMGVPRRKFLWHGAPRLHANLAEAFMSVYSQRSATMGSTLAARRAGM